MTAPDLADVRLSVVVPTFNRRTSVERLLRALARQDLAAGSFEVIVSVDGSADGTLEAVNAFRGLARLTAVAHPNSGRASACNRGIRAARGDIVVILDDDMEPMSGCLAGHDAAHAGNARRCVMGPVPVAERGSPLQRYIADKFAAHHRRLASPDHDFTLRDFYSGNTSVRRSVLDEIGLFDEDFAAYGNEDLELAVRLRSAGVEIAFVQAAAAWQHWEKTFPALAADTSAKGMTAVLLATKHADVHRELQIALFDRPPRWWRMSRAVLLAASRTPIAPRLVIAAAVFLGLVRFPRMQLFHRFVLDYFYWLGVSAALRERGVQAPLRAAVADWSTREPQRLSLH